MISVFPSVGMEYFMLQGNLPQNRNNILSLKEGSYRYFLYFCASIRVICNLVIVIRYYVR